MEIEFVPFTRYKSNLFTEANQYMKVKFTTVYEKGNQLIAMHPFAVCRDYLGDILQTTCTWDKHKEVANIYGLNYNPNKDGLMQLDRTRLVLQFPNKETVERFFKNLDIIWAIERANKLKETEVYPIEDKLYYILGSKKWLYNIAVYSFYTFMLRTICYPEISKENWIEDVKDYYPKESFATEAQYITSITPERLKKFIKNLSKFLIDLKPNPCGWESLSNIYTIHGSSGFYSIIQNGQFSGAGNKNKLQALSKEILWS